MMQGLSFALNSLNDTHQTDIDTQVPIEVDPALLEVDPISKLPNVLEINYWTDPSKTNGKSDLDETNSKIVSQNFTNYFLTDKVSTFHLPFYFLLYVLDKILNASLFFYLSCRYLSLELIVRLVLMHCLKFQHSYCCIKVGEGNHS